MKELLERLTLGLDVGSTTVKAVLTDRVTGRTLFRRYQRHHAEQRRTLCSLLDAICAKFAGRPMRIAVCGSGGRPLADQMGVCYVQEVVANGAAVRALYPAARTAVELGGQDAKVIFFRQEEDGTLTTSDMRMNGSCAGGTGAFIDEIAALLRVPSDQFEALAAQGRQVYSISGRCGVFAKTDIQTLLNQGASRADIALSAFHAIAKQTIGGLAQGLEMTPPVIFEGGPLTYNPTLVQVFAQRLGLSQDQIIRPDNADTIVALGAALAMEELYPLPVGRAAPITPEEALERLSAAPPAAEQHTAERYFATDAERQEWQASHTLPELAAPQVKAGDTLRVYIGVDAGSTTGKLVLLDENEQVVDRFYANNRGDPIEVIRHGLQQLHRKYALQGVTLEVLGLGTTGYGEVMLSKAFGGDYHTVETVAHAAAACHYVPDVTFLLDIGGQDMKAIWIQDGVVTNMLLNEACSSGCGSFLEEFAASLGIPVDGIADAAFRASTPAELGSRCTVFMNSSIITEQKNGRTPDDIMAGLCRSIIKNVFTKVVRIPNTDVLGSRIVVQGGTFKNDAVLRALEQYLGRTVTRAPYPGEMGAIGAALLTKRQAEASGFPASHFIGFAALDAFTYTQSQNEPCPFCQNHCSRTVIRFPGGESFVTGNRCERGEILGDPKDKAVQDKVRQANQSMQRIPNLFAVREKLLFADYDAPILAPDRGVTIGIPRVLSFWETMPFWNAFWRSLGFRIQLSGKSTRPMYEEGLSAVTSDTVCFPAKLVHGHLRDLAKKKVDRIFMPTITTVQPEGTASTSESMCAVVKGYPIVIRNSDDPQRRWGIPFDAPLFHWHHHADRDRQLADYMAAAFGISRELTGRAIAAGDAAQASFSTQLKAAGQAVLHHCHQENRYAVVLASRPYQNDELVNHALPELFVNLGIPVLTNDSLPDVNKVDLSRSRLDIVNNYHARMLASAVLAAQDECLEYVQIVSFGCGHDAYLSDEITRMMHEISGKSPLILKLDESDAQGSLRIRVRSFVETAVIRRARGIRHPVRQLPDPYPVKFTRQDKKDRVVLVPNTSHAFCRVMSAAFAAQRLRAVPLAVGREEAIRLGKQYVHNDICFPAQIVIGEALAALRSGQYDNSEVAVAMAKYIGDCRLTHYSALLRKALDDAGYADVPILTNDDKDSHNMHPGFKMNLVSSVNLAFSLPMIDVMEELLRKIRPYERVPGAADRAFEAGMDAIVDGMTRRGIPGLKKGFEQAIRLMKEVEYDRSRPRPTVLIVGEYLLNFHPGANHDIEKYLESNGFEIIEARMTDVIRKTYFYMDSQIKEYRISKPLGEKLWYRTADEVFNAAHALTDSIAKQHPLYHRAARMQDIVRASDPIIHHTFDAGEGVLIPAEILHHAKEGCRNFIILQPFGCLPNHVVGRGVAKRLKEMYPDAQILPLDYDPDVSFANLENRLQMLIMTEKARSQSAARNDRPGSATPPAPTLAPREQQEKPAARQRRGGRTAAVVPAQS
ncbi:acyl-CoA dehydratase activase [Faecalibacterium sp. An121]|uniref:acyl-CoA dehydratase activase n=1 Tax=Faecalibacterium sp. An121 TaxID=1965550 RepID=UPI000B3A6565|nr:acyl-CoA dehydratase activase [Faecalibacterium sp. An121]OUQ40687.1 activase [Faecalibacterium sp. An121]